MSTITAVIARRARAARTLGLPALLTVLALSLPAAAHAQSSSSTVTPEPSAAPAAPSATTKSATRHSMSGIDRRIADLHKRLKITPAEEQQWDQVADIMRQNEAAVAAAVKERAEHVSTMNAMENLQSFQKIAEAHEQGMEKLIPAFQSLYDSMSDAQKKNADEVFRAVAQRRAAHTKAKKKSG